MWKKFTSFCQVLKEMHTKENCLIFLPHGVDSGSIHTARRNENSTVMSRWRRWCELWQYCCLSSETCLCWLCVCVQARVARSRSCRIRRRVTTLWAVTTSTWRASSATSGRPPAPARPACSRNCPTENSVRTILTSFRQRWGVVLKKKWGDAWNKT